MRNFGPVDKQKRFRFVSVSSARVLLVSVVMETTRGKKPPTKESFLPITSILFGSLAGTLSIVTAAMIFDQRIRKNVDTSNDKLWGEGTRDIVEEASWESFPASDPPAW